MSELYVAPVSIDKEHIRSLLDLKCADLIRCGLDIEQALNISNSSNEEHVSNKIESLKDNAIIMRHLGAFVCGKMLGYVDICRLDELGDGEKLPVDDFIWEFSSVRAVFKGYPFLINELVANNQNTAIELLKRVNRVTGSGEVFIALDRNNPVKKIREFSEFESIGKYGKSDGIRKEIYFRDTCLVTKNPIRNLALITEIGRRQLLS